VAGAAAATWLVLFHFLSRSPVSHLGKLAGQLALAPDG
jgi:hypothetical protein